MKMGQISGEEVLHKSVRSTSIGKLIWRVNLEPDKVPLMSQYDASMLEGERTYYIELHDELQKFDYMPGTVSWGDIKFHNFKFNLHYQDGRFNKISKPMTEFPYLYFIGYEKKTDEGKPRQGLKEHSIEGIASCVDVNVSDLREDVTAIQRMIIKSNKVEHPIVYKGFLEL